MSRWTPGIATRIPRLPPPNRCSRCGVPWRFRAHIVRPSTSRERCTERACQNKTTASSTKPRGALRRPPPQCLLVRRIPRETGVGCAVRSAPPPQGSQPRRLASFAGRGPGASSAPPTPAILIRWSPTASSGDCCAPRWDPQTKAGKASRLPAFRSAHGSSYLGCLCAPHPYSLRGAIS